MEKAKQILETIVNGGHVSRWDVFSNRKEVLNLLNEGNYSCDVIHEVHFLIDSARESI